MSGSPTDTTEPEGRRKGGDTNSLTSQEAFILTKIFCTYIITYLPMPFRACLDALNNENINILIDVPCLGSHQPHNIHIGLVQSDPLAWKSCVILP